MSTAKAVRRVRPPNNDRAVMADGSIGVREHDIATLRRLEERILWLASWTIHNANHLRESRDGLKVGGHQASCASMTTLMAALYLRALRPQDRVAVKPHASPVFHAIQHLFGRQSLDQLQRFRALGGAQSYPSRTKDKDDVDFSTGSVGLGVAMTAFASLTQDYLAARGAVEAATSLFVGVFNLALALGALAGGASVDHWGLPATLLAAAACMLAALAAVAGRYRR